MVREPGADLSHLFQLLVHEPGADALPLTLLPFQITTNYAVHCQLSNNGVLSFPIFCVALLFVPFP